MKAYKKIMNGLAEIEKLAVSVLLSFVTVITFVNVVVRYCSDGQFAWTEELVVNLFVLLIMMGCGLCARECPVQAIARDEPRKPDRNKCISCMHCVSICPNEARKCKGLMMTLAARRLREACSGRKANVLYL